jgi:hypothetical protein
MLETVMGSNQKWRVQSVRSEHEKGAIIANAQDGCNVSEQHCLEKPNHKGQ